LAHRRLRPGRPGLQPHHRPAILAHHLPRRPSTPQPTLRNAPLRRHPARPHPPGQIPRRPHPPGPTLAGLTNISFNHGTLFLTSSSVCSGLQFIPAPPKSAAGAPTGGSRANAEHACDTYQTESGGNVQSPNSLISVLSVSSVRHRLVCINVHA